MIKLKDILSEGMSSRDIMDVVNKVYPKIVKDLGGSACKVEVHNNIYKRLGAVGIEDLMKDNNPYAQYDWELRKIYLYSSKIKDNEQIIRSLLHEHTHSRQNKKIFDKGYEEGKTYQNHPYERAAVASERKWKKYLPLLDEQISECVIAHKMIGDKIILAKNRDRTYTAQVKVVRELINDLEMVYIIDNDTDWSEGMNSEGIGIINSALMVNADEKEKKLAKKKGKPSEDGKKIRRALMFKKPQDTIMSVVNFKGDDKRDVGVKGHTFIATKNHTYAIEMTSEHKPVIKKLNRKNVHVRTNHGYDYKDSGYTSGANKTSSHLRWKYAQDILSNTETPEDILNGLAAYQADNMRNNPYRNVDKVKDKTKKDILSTTGQIMMNLTDLEFTLRMDSDKSKFFGIDDRTPEGYEPRIKVKVEYTKNKEVKSESTKLKDIMNEGKYLSIFDFDDTLVKSVSWVYVKKDGKEIKKLDAAQFAKYKPKEGEEFDFRDFDRKIREPKIIKRNVDLLKKQLSKHGRKVTILTARALGAPVNQFFKTIGIQPYVIPLGDANPQKKADYIEKQIQKGYNPIYFMDDSSKNINAVNKLKKRYPNIKLVTQLVKH
jgi:hypothetical protein